MPALKQVEQLPHGEIGSSFTLRDESGEPLRFIGVRRASEGKRAKQALQFLAAASAALDRSNDFDATLHTLATLTVPHLGDWAIVDITDGEGGVHSATGVHVSPPGGAVLVEALVHHPAGKASSSLARAAIDSGASHRASGVASSLFEEFGDQAAISRLVSFGARSAIAVPLTARGGVLGAITLASTKHAHHDRDIALAEELARRGAAALDNARLCRDAQESDRRKQEFLAVLAHELRNPLAPLVTSLELLKLSGPVSEPIGRIHEAMERQVRNLARLVDGLLTVSRITRGLITLQRQSIELATLVERAVETARPVLGVKSIHVSMQVEAGVRLEADPLRLEQVLTNLLDNAARYTASGGHVEIWGGHQDGGIVLQVRDDGIGISPEVLPRMFDLFFQGRPPGDHLSGGLGIGLTLARAIVELHGGTLKATSAGLGRGSQLEVRLPISEPPASSGSAAREPEPSGTARVAPPSQRVIVVDDNTDAALALAAVLRLRGHQVWVMHDGRSALDEALKILPDVMLLDIGLPDIDGYELARRIRSQPGLDAIRLVAISSLGQSHHLERSKSLGFSAHLVKPADLAQIDQKLGL